MHHAHVLLRRAHVAGVLEGDPGVAGLEQHGEHPAPQVGGAHRLEQLDLAARGLRLVGGVGLLERLAELVVQVGAGRGREQRPVAAFHDAAHEQVGHPVGGVHVVRAPAVVAGVLAQLQELLDVEVPGLQVGADGALSLAALVDRHRGVVDHLQERHHALALAVGALDVAAERAHVGPVVAQAAGELRQQRVLLDRLVDAFEVVGDGGQVAARQLRAPRARVEQRRRRAHEVERRQHLVELDGARLAVDLAQRQAHRHAHVERLRQLDARLADVQEVAVVERLQAEVVELQVALGPERRAQARQVELQQLVVEQLGVDAAADELREVLGVARRHVGLQRLLAEHLLADGVQQQPRGGAAVARVLLDQRARGEDRRLVHLLHRHAVVEVAPRLGHDRAGLHVGAQALAGRGEQHLQAGEVERDALPVLDRAELRLGGRGALALARALLRAPLAVEHVGAGHLVVAAAHQAQLDLVLHVLDVEGAAARARAQQRAHHRLGEAVDRLAHARRGRPLRAVHGEEGLHQRDGDLVRLEGDDGAVAADDLVGVVGRGARRRGGGPGGGGGFGDGGDVAGVDLHGRSFGVRAPRRADGRRRVRATGGRLRSRSFWGVRGPMGPMQDTPQVVCCTASEHYM